MTDTANPDESEVIWQALSNLPLSDDRRADLWNRADDFVDRVRYAGLVAGIRQAAVGKRGSPAEIVKGIGKVSRGLKLIEQGLSTIDGAQRSTSQAAALRDAELGRVQRSIIHAIVSAVTPRLSVTGDPIQVEIAMPSYGTHGFANSWNGLFSAAAHHVDQIKASVPISNLKAPKVRDEWLTRLIAILAGIYEDVSGRAPAAYTRGGDSLDPKYRAPFVRFVQSVWPVISCDEPPPTPARIRDAQRHASELPPSTEAQ